MSDSVWPHRQKPTRLPRPWDPPGKNTGVGFYFLLQCMKVKSEVAQSCPTLSDPMDCSLPGSSIRGIFQARVLEWGAIKIFLSTIQLKLCVKIFYLGFLSILFFIFIFYFLNFILFNSTILYWFCHISEWICHRYICVPHPELSSLPIPSLWVVPVHQPQASSIVHQTWTGDSFHIWYDTYFNAILPNHPTLSLSHRVQKTVLYISVSFAVSYTVLLLPSF